MEVILHSLTDHRLMPLFQTIIGKNTFQDNFLPPKVDGPVIDLISVDVIVISCSFIGSNMTVISLRNTYLNLYGSTTCENNTAEIGGALKVCEASLIFGHNGTALHLSTIELKKEGQFMFRKFAKTHLLYVSFSHLFQREHMLHSFPTLFSLILAIIQQKLQEIICMVEILISALLLSLTFGMIPIIIPSIGISKTYLLRSS